MTIDEAKRNLGPAVMVAENEGNWTKANAIKLGIEALKRLQEYRRIYPDDRLCLLSGETKD